MVWEENKVRILGITIGNELRFDSYVLNICPKANKKLISFLCRLKSISSEGYSLSRFLKCSLNTVLLCGCSVVDPPITKSVSFTKDSGNRNV